MATSAIDLLTDDDAEERRELEEVGALAQNTELPPADLDAVASDLLRIMRREKAQIDRDKEAMTAEIQRIQMRYGHRMAGYQARYDQAQGLVEEIARRAEFPGKSKSRKVGWGSYGRRKVNAGIDIVDEAAAVAWLKGHGHTSLVRVKEEVMKGEAKPVLLKLMDEDGVVVDGVEKIPESEKPFAKVED